METITLTPEMYTAVQSYLGKLGGMARYRKLPQYRRSLIAQKAGYLSWSKISLMEKKRRLKLCHEGRKHQAKMARLQKIYEKTNQAEEVTCQGPKDSH